jgi:two-component system chemotaxis sensor kinase CheA
MNLAGQLVINRARFGQIGAKLKGFSAIKSTLNTVASAQRCASRLTIGMDEYFGSQSSPEMDELRMIAAQMRGDLESLQHDLGQMTHMRTALNDLSEAVHQLDRVSDGIQNTVMDTRMVPIGPLFMRFKRVVRDLTRTSNKQIELVIVGESTELDKRMIDELGDPLIHLIRNSADHGIESPEERIAAGKNPQGTITLNAFHRGNRIVIQITDDGKGLDADRILAKAISKGIVKESDAERMTPQQIYQLIWQPGFSTAEKVTEVSGRGMGMDIVQSKVEQINGAIELRSEPGHGTTFEIKLPLTMAILPSLLIVIDGDVFAIPVESVVEIVRIPNSEVGTVHGQRTARVRDRVVSVIELNDVFTWNQIVERDPVPCEDQTLVIVGVEGSELGLRVDALLGEQDVVIKSLEENFQNVGGVAGASILGDGRVSLILDVGSLLAMSQQGHRTVETEETAAV